MFQEITPLVLMQENIIKLRGSKRKKKKGSQVGQGAHLEEKGFCERGGGDERETRAKNVQNSVCVCVCKYMPKIVK